MPFASFSPCASKDEYINAAGHPCISTPDRCYSSPSAEHRQHTHLSPSVDDDLVVGLLPADAKPVAIRRKGKS
jgi:hypothetical protein